MQTYDIDMCFRESLFRQLCAVNWILDAMSQDVFPPVVVPITNCWNIKYVVMNEVRGILNTCRLQDFPKSCFSMYTTYIVLQLCGRTIITVK